VSATTPKDEWIPRDTRPPTGGNRNHTAGLGVLAAGGKHGHHSPPGARLQGRGRSLVVAQGPMVRPLLISTAGADGPPRSCASSLPGTGKDCGPDMAGSQCCGRPPGEASWGIMHRTGDLAADKMHSRESGTRGSCRRVTTRSERSGRERERWLRTLPDPTAARSRCAVRPARLRRGRDATTSTRQPRRGGAGYAYPSRTIVRARTTRILDGIVWVSAMRLVPAT
jgi:hypothetical protein